MKIGLVGWGIETQSVFRYFGEEHDYLIVNEEPRDDFPTGPNITLQTLKEKRRPGLTGNVQEFSYLDGIEKCDIIVLSPTAKKVLEQVFLKDHEIWEKVTSNLQIFFEVCPTKNIIGVTGTKGKGTTSSLITELLRAGGKTVHLGGNIGHAALDLLPQIQKDDWVVLELSNFQLYKFPYSPHIAVHLMMIPEHINEWHIKLEDYIDAKGNIFRHQTPNDIAIYLPSNELSAHNVELSDGTHIPYMEQPGAFIDRGSVMIEGHSIIKTSAVGLRGKHNIENICAAVTAVWQVHQNVEAMQKVIKDFKGLEHRLQIVGQVDNVLYVDDSFGTTPDTAIVAMNAFEQPKVMIVGGHDKGNDMTKMIQRLCEDDIRSVIGIGEVGLGIVNVLRKKNLDALLHTKEESTNWSMAEIVALARDDAKDGDVVLLSAGTSSFGIFKDYKDRGNQFVAEIMKLQK